MHDVACIIFHVFYMSMTDTQRQQALSPNSKLARAQLRQFRLVTPAGDNPSEPATELLPTEWRCQSVDDVVSSVIFPHSCVGFVDGDHLGIV